MALGTKRLWAVNANWNADNDGWNVNANSVDNPNRWNADNQVVSRNSSVSPTLMGGSFCLRFPFSNRPALDRFPQAFQEIQHIAW